MRSIANFGGTKTSAQVLISQQKKKKIKKKIEKILKNKKKKKKKIKKKIAKSKSEITVNTLECYFRTNILSFHSSISTYLIH